MDPILAEIYSTILPSAPFVIAAYALILLVLGVYIFVISRSIKKSEEEIALLEEEFAERRAATLAE